MNKKKALMLIVILLLIVLASLVACSQREQVRWSGTAEMGDLPEDIKYVEGVPRVISVSTESDGDIVLSYISNEDKIVAQLYGCPTVSLACSDLKKQGKYVWDIPSR